MNMNKIKTKLRYFLLGIMLLLSPNANTTDNEVTLAQKGANFDLQILQAGYDNEIDVDLGCITSSCLGYAKADNLSLRIIQKDQKNDVYFSLDGDNNDIFIYQEGPGQNSFGWTDLWGAVNCGSSTWCGDIDGDNNTVKIQQIHDGSNSETNLIGVHIWGSNNELDLGQGCHYTSGSDTTCDIDDHQDGGHRIVIDVHASNLDLQGSQDSGANYANHTADLRWYGADNNDVFFRQRGNGAKTLTLLVYSDNNDISIEQKSDGAHTAAITIYGSQPTTLNLLQKSGSATSYSLSQNCNTSGGCSVSVTQE